VGCTPPPFHYAAAGVIPPNEGQTNSKRAGVKPTRRPLSTMPREEHTPPNEGVKEKNPPRMRGGKRSRRGQRVGFTLPPIDDAARTTGVGTRGTIGAILSPVVDKNSRGRRVRRPLSPPPLFVSLLSVLSSLPSCCYPSMVTWHGWWLDVAAFGAHRRQR
jgi:hypothetical protein